jgi:hypothetical protein
VRPEDLIGVETDVEEVLALLEPGLTLARSDSGFVFSFSSPAGTDATFTRNLPAADVLAILVRHWVRTDERLGLEWYLISDDSRLSAKTYLTLGPAADLHFAGPPPLFLAGIDLGDEMSIFSGESLNLTWVIERLVNTRGEAAAPSLARQGIDLPPAQQWRPHGRPEPLVVWLYWDNDEEIRSVSPRDRPPYVDPSRDLVLLSFADIYQPVSQSLDGTLSLAPSIAVRSGDIVFAHGFGKYYAVREALRLAGATVIDYSSKDEAWVNIVVPALGDSPQSAVIRDCLLAYAERQRQRGATALVRRVLHRSVNKLAPLRIDLTMIAELAEAGDRKGVLDQLREMGTEWTSQFESHPLYCLAGLQTMLVGRVSGMEKHLKRFKLPLASVEQGDVIFERFEISNSLTNEGRRLLSRLIELAGLYKADDGYVVRDAGEALHYITAIAEVVQEVGLDSDGHELARFLYLADSLVDIARLRLKTEIFSERAGVQGFSYAAWLEEVAELLERLYEQAEASEKGLQ